MPNRPLVSSQQVRGAFLIGTVGIVALILVILLLATARPQGRLVPVDDSVYQERLAAAETAMTGFALVGEGAQLELGYAMELLVERGVTTPIYAGGVAPSAPAAGAVAADGSGPDGAALYAQHCSACHQATGAGIPMAFPPLVGHVGALVSAERSYPPQIVMFGLMGQIEVLGTNYFGVMPGLAAVLSDAQIAAILNHVVTTFDPRDGFEVYTADEIATWRQPALQMSDTHAIRLGLTLP
jgi:mono/diheme cytochrome c family protein